MAAYTYVDAPRTLQDCLKHLRDVIVAMDDSCVARRAWKLLAVEWPEADLASWLFPQAVPPHSQMFSGGAHWDWGGIFLGSFVRGHGGGLIPASCVYSARFWGMPRHMLVWIRESVWPNAAILPPACLVAWVRE